MRGSRLEVIEAPFWGLEEVIRALGLTRAAARVFVCREHARGAIVRVRRNLYVLPSALRRFSREGYFRLANACHTPSCVSLGTALAYHGISTQIPQAVIESVSPVRSGQHAVGDTTLQYYFIKPSRYGGFERSNGYFVATAEKALLDALYLQRYGRYDFDDLALDLSKISRQKFGQFLNAYPKDFKEYVRSYRSRHD